MESGYQRVTLVFLGNNTKKTIMGYGMKYTKGGFPFKSTPAKQTKTPNPTTKAVGVDHSKTLSTHLDSRGPIKGDYQMENKGDFNISNLHKDTKISLDKKKMNKGKKKHPLGIEDPAELKKLYEKTENKPRQ